MFIEFQGGRRVVAAHIAQYGPAIGTTNFLGQYAKASEHVTLLPDAVLAALADGTKVTVAQELLPAQVAAILAMLDEAFMQGASDPAQRGVLRICDVINGLAEGRYVAQDGPRGSAT